MDKFVEHFFPSPPKPIQVLPDASRHAARFAGSYQHVKHSWTTVEKLGTMRAGQVYISANDDGTLNIYGDRYAEIAPMVFRLIDGFELVAFREDKAGRITFAFLGQETYKRLAWYESSFIQQILLCFFFLTFGSAFFGWQESRPISAFDQSVHVSDARAQRAKQIAMSASALNLGFLLALAFIFIRTGAGDIWFGFPASLSMLLHVPFLCAALTIWLLKSAVIGWRRGTWPLKNRVHLTMIAVAAAAFIPFLYYWNLIG